MVRTIEDGFRLLRSSLEITGLQESTVSTRQQRVRDVIEADFDVLDSFLAGSYRRSTMIAPLVKADIDIFIVLNARHHARNNQQALLEAVKSSLLKTYTRSPRIRPAGNAVTITFTDFAVDVVPAFHRQGGGYLIPDAEASRWISTDPKQHIALWADANRRHAGNLVPLLKMLKGWNKSRQLLKSFHLETIALSILDGVRIVSFPSGIRYVLERAGDRLTIPLPDPAGYSADIGAHLCESATIDNVQKRVAWAAARASEAEELAASGRNAEAFAKWAVLLPGYFPAYA